MLKHSLKGPQATQLTDACPVPSSISSHTKLFCSQTLAPISIHPISTTRSQAISPPNISESTRLLDQFRKPPPKTRCVAELQLGTAGPKLLSRVYSGRWKWVLETDVRNRCCEARYTNNLRWYRTLQWWVARMPRSTRDRHHAQVQQPARLETT